MSLLRAALISDPATPAAALSALGLSCREWVDAMDVDGAVDDRSVAAFRSPGTSTRCAALHRIHDRDIIVTAAATYHIDVAVAAVDHPDADGALLDAIVAARPQVAVAVAVITRCDHNPDLAASLSDDTATTILDRVEKSWRRSYATKSGLETLCSTHRDLCRTRVAEGVARTEPEYLHGIEAFDDDPTLTLSGVARSKDCPHQLDGRIRVAAQRWTSGSERFAAVVDAFAPTYDARRHDSLAKTTADLVTLIDALDALRGGQPFNDIVAALGATHHWTFTSAAIAEQLISVGDIDPAVTPQRAAVAAAFEFADTELLCNLYGRYTVEELANTLTSKNLVALLDGVDPMGLPAALVFSRTFSAVLVDAQRCALHAMIDALGSDQRSAGWRLAHELIDEFPGTVAELIAVCA